jgi:hypothetical protein
MQKLFVAAIGAASLLAVPALAQTATTTPQSTTQPSPSASATAPNGDTMQVRQKLTQDLQKDGFKNIRIVADSFLVHAVNKQGEPVVMIINPDSVFAMTQVNASSNGQNAQPASSTTASK